jgi:glycosyltransferase involved in cell wall biosynthesis
MLDVLKACLNSIRENTEQPYDLLVFDNASCEEVRQYLLDEHQSGRIQILMFSDKNLGKGGAWNAILGGAPGEIITYTDNDCLFYKDWLPRSLQLLETFPNVGMVTARPFRTNEAFYTSTEKWGRENLDAMLESGHFIPFEVFREFDLSLGQSEEEIKSHYERTKDVRMTYKNVSAIAGASHWQFTTRKEIIAQYLPFSMDRPMGQVKQLDQRMNEAGYLRLMPTEPFVMNMSNTLRNLPGLISKSGNNIKLSGTHPILDFPPIKKGLLGLYDSIFRWYYDRQVD